MIYLWLLLALLAAGVEAFTCKRIALSFLPSAIVSMILAFFYVDTLLQIAAFLGSSLLFFFFFRWVFRFAVKERRERGGIESAIGEKCTVAERIDNLAGRGAVILHGKEWATRTVSDEITAEVGERVEIIAVEGVRLVCKKI